MVADRELKAMIELRSVRKFFGSTPALEALDLTIDSGRTTVLIGPSGCGKSTLLRLLIGLVEPDSGTVAIDGRVTIRATTRHGATASATPLPALIRAAAKEKEVIVPVAIRGGQATLILEYRWLKEPH